MDQTMAATLDSARAIRRPDILRGLLWREWLGQRRMLGWIAQAYAFSPLVAFFWLVVGPSMLNLPHVTENPGMASPDDWRHLGWLWTYWVGIALAIYLGLMGGGAETTAGLEEGSLSLPATRAERYKARLLFCAIILSAHLLLNTLALAVWDLVLTRPDLPPGAWFNWFAYLCAGPWAAFAISWTVAVNGGPRRRLLMFIMALALPYLALIPLAPALGDRLEWSGALLLWPWTLWMLWLGYRIYLTREVHAIGGR